MREIMGRRDPYRWLDGLQAPAPDAPFEILGAYSRLYTTRKGALLDWVFDESAHDTAHHLLVGLTKREARLVASRGLRRGMLELVRHRLRHPGAILFVENAERIAVRRFLVPWHATEREFCNDLMLAADNVPEGRTNDGYSIWIYNRPDTSEHRFEQWLSMARFAREFDPWEDLRVGNEERRHTID
jgi:hypothetical protein